MTAEQFDSTLIPLLQQEPFQPFVVELIDGKHIQIDGPRLAIGGGGATMLTREDWIEFQCDQVSAIRTGASVCQISELSLTPPAE